MKNDIIAAISTPIGLGGIGVIRLSGDGCIELVHEKFSNKKILTANGYTIHHGYFHSIQNEILDECLISIFRQPHSYTKEDVIEISCHGSPFILSEILKTLIASGARQANGGEFTLRAFLNGQLNLSQAEAVGDLIKAESFYSHKLALDQLRGGYSKDLIELRTKLIEFASLIELELDFGEEDVEFADREDILATIKQLSSKLIELINSFDLGNSLKQGIKVVIAGNPNAGKSTLLNGLLNADRAIISSTPGTTRDTIDDYLIIDGIKFLLTDTAGIRTSSDEIEEQGIKKTFTKIEHADIILYVVDITAMSASDTIEELKSINSTDKQLIVILNKMDLYPNMDIQTYKNSLINIATTVIPISAINKMNLTVITETLVHQVKSQKAVDKSIVTNIRHYESLTNAFEALSKVVEGINHKLSGDLLAIDIRQVLHHIGMITGEIHTDDLLESIFSSFCIGK